MSFHSSFDASEENTPQNVSTMENSKIIQSEPKGEIVIVVAGLPLQEKREHRNKYKDYEDTSEEIVPQKQE